MLCSACGGLGLTLTQIISPPRETHFYFINAVLFFLSFCSHFLFASSCENAAALHITPFRTHSRQGHGEMGNPVVKSYALTDRKM